MFGGNRIKLDKGLFEKLKKYSALGGYSSVEEFATHILETEIAKVEEGGEDEEELTKRLKGLGYIA